uniref:Uncharacterized protein n=1 Tax=Cacopsylla melanoneura TaxID=428564 RepID=A0A8D8TD85_9HEMI
MYTTETNAIRKKIPIYKLLNVSTANSTLQRKVYKIPKNEVELLKHTEPNTVLVLLTGCMFQISKQEWTLTLKLVTISHFSFPITGLLLNVKSQTRWTANLF